MEIKARVHRIINQGPSEHFRMLFYHALPSRRPVRWHAPFLRVAAVVSNVVDSIGPVDDE
jgi:hypothetical protein